MSKRAYIIHAWDEGPESCWYPWLKAQLEGKGFEVNVPAMPNPAAPNIEAWVDTLRSLVPQPDSQTYFIGHSIGCQTILRYLGQLEGNEKIGGAVFVAPWTHLNALSGASQHIAKPWLETPINWEMARSRCPQYSALFSDDDQWVPLSEEKVFKETLGATTQVLAGMGHFDEMKQLPQVLKKILDEA